MTPALAAAQCRFNREKTTHCSGIAESGQSRSARRRPTGPPTVKHPLQQAEFVLSAAQCAQLPPPGPPEIAFAGRRTPANRARSMRSPTGRGSRSRARRRAARNRSISSALRGGALLADLPGYGYAAVPRELKRHWQEFLGRYVATRQSLVGLVLVVDARHGLSDLDRALLAGFLPCGRPVLILATKMDKLAASAQREATRAIERGCRCRVSRARDAGDDRAVFGDAPHRDRDGRSHARRMASRAAAIRRGRTAYRAAQKKRPRDQGE